MLSLNGSADDRMQAPGVLFCQPLWEAFRQIPVCVKPAPYGNPGNPTPNQWGKNGRLQSGDRQTKCIRGKDLI